MEKVRREKMQVREKVGKSRNTVFFPMFCGSGGSKSRLGKAAGAETCWQMGDEKLHAFLAPSDDFLEVKVSKIVFLCLYLHLSIPANIFQSIVYVSSS